MPPLPSTIDDETTRAVESLNRRQKDLTSYQIPRLRDCKGPLSTQQQYAAELKDDLDAFGQQVDSLEMLGEDQLRKPDRQHVKHLVDEFRSSQAKMRKDMRTALLESKKTIDANSRSHRDELLRSSAILEKPRSDEKASDDALMSANNDVTEALRRTIGLMQGELERSVLTTQMLDSSTAILQATSITHDSLNTVMGTSRQLITALEKADWMDRLLIMAGLCFFLLVVLFILKQRIVDRGLRIAFWWTRFIPDFSGDAALLADEKVGRISATGTDVMSSLLSSATSLLSGDSSTTVSSAAETIYENPRTLPVDQLEQAASSLSLSLTGFMERPMSTALSIASSPVPSETLVESVAQRVEL
ncbi:Sec20-domain-containing protein [Rickenella mellea]|uniref:Sec20-domain-containing protein n=1 Tax=Rickenella mellea TaxID=50990 RepID=A0A4Y7Q614_9AGAM|nr:Sec20-domain-containing protein [Rickenella mellea]